MLLIFTHLNPSLDPASAQFLVTIIFVPKTTDFPFNRQIFCHHLKKSLENHPALPLHHIQYCLLLFCQTLFGMQKKVSENTRRAITDKAGQKGFDPLTTGLEVQHSIQAELPAQKLHKLLAF